MTAHLRSCETGEPFLEEHRLMARDGTIAWFLDEASVVPGATGRRLPTTTARIDISERKPLEYALAHRTKELRRQVGPGARRGTASTSAASSIHRHTARSSATAQVRSRSSSTGATSLTQLRQQLEATAMAGTLAAPTSLVADAEAGCVRAERALRALTRR